MIDPDIQKYYDTYFDLFISEGWKQFLTDVQDASEIINILTIQDAKELHLAQGQLQVFNRLLNWENSIRNAYELVLEQQEQEESDG